MKTNRGILPLGIIILLVILIGGGAVYYNKHKIENNIPSQNQQYINEATTAFTKYLISNGGLSDYKINKVTLEVAKATAIGTMKEWFAGYSNDAFLVSVEYSVKPNDNTRANWILGAATDEHIKVRNDGWIDEDAGYVFIDKTSDGFKVVSVGSGP